MIDKARSQFLAMVSRGRKGRCDKEMIKDVLLNDVHELEGYLRYTHVHAVLYISFLPVAQAVL